MCIRDRSRRLRDLIPMATSKLQPQLIVPSVVTQNIAERKQKAKAHYDKRASKRLSEFTIGQGVFVKLSQGTEANPGYMATRRILLFPEKTPGSP